MANTKITADVIEANAVLAVSIADENITSAKLADLAVTEGKIANTAITAGKIATDAVITAKIQDGAITSAKLASGVGGVAGIVSNADATAITIDSSENVGIGTASPDAKLAIDATSQGNFTEAMRISNTGGGANEGNYIQFEISNTSGYGPRIGGRREGSGGSGLHFYTGENNAVPTEKVRIDHDGNVGIGTASPSEKLTIQSGNINFMGGTNDAQYIKFGDTGDDDIGNILYYHGNNNMVFTTNASEAMRIDASSNLGIGTTSPSSYNSAMNDLVVAGSGDSGITIASGTSSEGSIGFADGTSGADAYRGWINYNHANNFMRFFTNASEAMRIDSLGNFLVGTTTTNIATEGAVIYGSGNEGVMQLSSTNMTALYVNRSTDGELVQFRKAAAVVGSIGTDATDIYIGTTDTGIRFNDAVNGVLPYNTSSGQTDNTIDLGFSSVRWKDIYAANGTIQTSDINEKQDIEDLTEAETRVAVSAKGLLKKYRWKSAVEEKGNDARIHFGIMAQDLQDAFAAEGLDAGDYGMFISTTWTDETTGEEKTRLGVRYNELLAFIIAAI